MIKFILKILILIAAVIAFLYFFDISFKNRGVEIKYRKGGELKQIKDEVGEMGEKVEKKVEKGMGKVGDKVADKIKGAKEKAGDITDADRKKLEDILEKKK